MKVLAHVFNTWFIANLLHPVCWAVASAIEGGIMEIQWMFFILVYGLFFSLPALLFSWMSMAIVMRFKYHWYEKFFLWFVFAIISLIIWIYFFLIVTLKSLPSIEEFTFLIPAIVAVILSITIRYRSFIKLTSPGSNI